MTRPEIVAAARGWIGTPYRHQASLKGVGCDCLGLLRGVWRELLGGEPEPVPPYTRDWAEAGGRELLMDVASRHLVRVEREAQPGDVLLFRWRAGLPAKHCAIVGAPGTMIHAHEGAAVAEVAIAPFWSRQIAAVFAFPDVEER
jgi:NlpC/P60 family putative phage cell wall peptidase